MHCGYCAYVQTLHVCAHCAGIDRDALVRSNKVRGIVHPRLIAARWPLGEVLDARVWLVIVCSIATSLFTIGSS